MGTRGAVTRLPLAMFDAAQTTSQTDDAEIARHEVSEDGVTWRPYDPHSDKNRAILHQRIEFAAPSRQTSS